MNFEIIDNTFQVTVFFLAMTADVVCWLLWRNRLFIILALAHACFMMGTLYFVLHLAIRGVVPQVFYVAEISWISSYLFLHSYQIVRYQGRRPGLSWLPLICGIGIAAVSMWSEIFGPALLSTGAFAVVAGAITYVCVYQILNNGRAGQDNNYVNDYTDNYADYHTDHHANHHRMNDMLLTDVCILLCVILQVTLYDSSLFIHDYTKFSLYFGIDFVLTISHAMLLPCTIWDVRRNLGGVKNNDVH